MFYPGNKVLIQGINPPLAQEYAQKMKAYGTNLVAAISTDSQNINIDGIPVYDSVEQVISHQQEINTSLIFVPPYQVLDAAMEAISAGIRQIIIITRHIPPLDLIKLFQQAERTNTVLLGPGSNGIIVPQSLWWGIGEVEPYVAGDVGIISRSYTLIHQISSQLTSEGIGQSVLVHLGEEEMMGSDFTQWLTVLEKHSSTKVILMMAQAGARAEVKAVEYISKNFSKPVVIYTYGLYAGAGVSFPNIDGRIATQLSYSVPRLIPPEESLSIFQKARLPIAKSLSEIFPLVTQALSML